MSGKHIRIMHRDSGQVLAEGPLGWGITPFEGNFYIQKKYLKTEGFKPNFLPGLCIFKFFYVWLDLKLDDGTKLASLGWLYFLPNPLFPFIWFRVGLPRDHAELSVEEYIPQAETSPAS